VAAVPAQLHYICLLATYLAVLTHVLASVFAQVLAHVLAWARTSVPAGYLPRFMLCGSRLDQSHREDQLVDCLHRWVITSLNTCAGDTLATYLAVLALVLALVSAQVFAQVVTQVPAQVHALAWAGFYLTCGTRSLSCVVV